MSTAFGERAREKVSAPKFGQIKFFAQTRERQPHASRYQNLELALNNYKGKDDEYRPTDKEIRDYLQIATNLDDKISHLDVSLLAAAFIYQKQMDKKKIPHDFFTTLDPVIKEKNYNKGLELLGEEDSSEFVTKLDESKLSENEKKYFDRVRYLSSLMDDILDIHLSFKFGDTSKKPIPEDTYKRYKLSLVSYLRMLDTI